MIAETGTPTYRELYEFGPFRVDAEKETLQRSGEQVGLTPKTFQILLVLVRHSQEIVTKDDLLKTVWPDTFVEEGNLSRNIFMLRKALGESSKDHRYILTVPGRGYRFAERVHLLPGQEVSMVAATHSVLKLESKETRPWRWFAAVAVLAAALVGLGLWKSAKPKPALTAKDSVVMAEFANNTGDPVFSGSLREGLAVELEQSPFLKLISDRQIEHGLKMMARPAGAQLTPALALDLCRRLGGSAMLEGSISSLGNQYVLNLRATACKEGELLAQEQIETKTKEDVLNALSTMAVDFRKRLGESLSTVSQHNTPLAVATTPSLEALEAYSAALRAHESVGASASLPLFRRAVELDPEFAMAHAFLGRAFADLDESDLAAQSIRRAWELRDHASDRERFFITVNYEMLVTGDMEAAQQTTEAWARSYPRDAAPHILASGLVSKEPALYARGIAEATQGVALDPDFAMGYYNLAVHHAYRDELDEASAALHRATERGLDAEEYMMLSYDLAFLRGDRAAMERVAAQARTRPHAESWISSKESSVLAYTGQLDKARLMMRQAVDQSRQAGQVERAGTWEAGASVREALFGNSPEASERAKAALHLTNTRDAEYGVGFALALSGSVRQAAALADDLERRFPEDTSVHMSYLPTLRAQLALRASDPAQALRLLQVAIPHELGTTPSSLHACFGSLYPAYVRGEAYLAAHDGGAAAREFEKIAQHPGITVSDPIGPVAELQLARAYVMAGQNARGKLEYERFLLLWANADPSTPVLLQARAEHAKLS